MHPPHYFQIFMTSYMEGLKRMTLKISWPGGEISASSICDAEEKIANLQSPFAICPTIWHWMEVSEEELKTDPSRFFDHWERYDGESIRGDYRVPPKISYDDLTGFISFALHEVKKETVTISAFPSGLPEITCAEFRAFRVDLGISRQRLAVLLDISEQAIWRIEYGEMLPPHNTREVFRQLEQERQTLIQKLRDIIIAHSSEANLAIYVPDNDREYRVLWRRSGQGAAWWRTIVRIATMGTQVRLVSPHDKKQFTFTTLDSLRP